MRKKETSWIHLDFGMVSYRFSHIDRERGFYLDRESIPSLI